MANFSYANLTHVKMMEELYELFLTDPSQVDPSWRNFFEGFEFAEKKFPTIKEKHVEDGRIVKLIEAYRTYGHFVAKTNPIFQKAPQESRELELNNLGFKQEELSQEFPTYGILPEKKTSLNNIIKTLQQIYCNSIGIEYMGFQSPNLEKWVQKTIEPNQFNAGFNQEEKKEILNQLNKAELFEVFLHTKYVGQKRFSLEGNETLLPILARIIEKGASIGMEELIIGMSHRGRLNILANLLNKPYRSIFLEFEDNIETVGLGKGGDVKYHKGISADIVTKEGKKVHLSLAANPSHLESVDSVVEGIVRAKQAFKQDTSCQKIVPLLIHGDASIAGQGEVYECMQFCKLAGYKTGGTIHIILNNQIGFTTLPHEGRSTHYCTDIARTFSCPVFHVNAEDPESCVYAAELALHIRHHFHCDVFIDLIGYRKFGHNEGDEPFFTQPLEYKIIQKKQSIRDIYLSRLVAEKVLDHDNALQIEKTFKDSLHLALEESKTPGAEIEESTLKGIWNEFKQPSQNELMKNYETAVSLTQLKTLATSFCTLPKDFNPHSKIKRLLEERAKIIQSDPSQKNVDWGLAEHLAFASLLVDGTPIRLSGQDSQRGTFSHRHAVIVDQNNHHKYFPLQHLSESQALFEVYNSPLSEFAVLGFEFGYSLAYPQSLVIWEAQFGDFANGAQVIIDQYLTCSEQKWARFSGLVLYLPHGYEGQGPEHSSARIERYLQLTAENNIQVVNPTTSGQLFHLLRRQMIRPFRKPLIVFTPKSFLRLPFAMSSLNELAESAFKEVLEEETLNFSPTTLVFCSGKIFYDLVTERNKRNSQSIAFIRIEQFYPWPEEMIKMIIQKYNTVENYVWFQEEPVNMGAWDFIRNFLQPLLKKQLQCIGRKRSASPAIGSHFLHHKEQEALMNQLFGEK